MVTPFARSVILVMTLIAITFQKEAAGKGECADPNLQMEAIPEQNT
jgi:hypothetical protein